MNVRLMRIKALIENEKIGLNEFDRRIDRSSYVSNALNRDSKITKSTLDAVKKAFPEYSYKWLRGENVPMYEKDVPDELKEPDDNYGLNFFEKGILKALRKPEIRKEIQSIIAEMSQK